MNNPTYPCPKCGNTERFVELVWEQRRYPIDRRGETTGVSESVEETEVPIQFSCANCGNVIKQLEVSCFRDGFYITNYQPVKEAKQSELSSCWEELPDYTDFDDLDGMYLKEFTLEALETTVENKFQEILREYQAAAPAKRIVMNRLLTILCGYSLPELIKKAHGSEAAL